MILADRRTFRLEEQTIVLPDFPADGWILDLGAGGQAVIGQLKADQVIAIDLLPCRHGKLEFPDCSFNTVTAFFIFLSIPPNKHKEVLQEIYRVLAPGGKFLLWDVEIHPCPEQEREIMVMPLQVRLPNTVLQTEYGTRYTEQCITLHDYILQACDIGFEWVEQGFAKQTFFCKFQKP